MLTYLALFLNLFKIYHKHNSMFNYLPFYLCHSYFLIVEGHFMLTNDPKSYCIISVSLSTSLTSVLLWKFFLVSCTMSTVVCSEGILLGNSDVLFHLKIISPWWVTSGSLTVKQGAGKNRRQLSKSGHLQSTKLKLHSGL